MQLPGHSDLLSQGVLCSSPPREPGNLHSEQAPAPRSALDLSPTCLGAISTHCSPPRSTPHNTPPPLTRHWPPPALPEPQPSAQSPLVTKKGLENPFGGRLRKGRPQCHETRANTKCGVIGGFLIRGPLCSGAEPAAGLPGSRAGPSLPAL